MMGYNEIANQDHQLNFLDPFRGSNARKFRPLVPRLNLSPPTHSPCLTGFHNPTSTHHHLLSLNNNSRPQHNHCVGLSEENNSKEVVGANQVMVSSRWNPTPEQLRALEELYRRGTRTPSAEQIQHITAQLRRYGKIEGKNVFYWFQNHKARERQKRRRQLQLPSPPGSSTTRGNRVGIEGEQMSCKWTPSSTTKESDRPINQITSEETAEGKADQTRTTTTTHHNIGWIQFHEPPQFQHNHTTNNTIHNNNIITPTNDNTNNDNMINSISSPSSNLMLAGEKNSTWQSQNNTMVQQPFTPLSSSPCCCYPSTTILSKINHLVSDKSAGIRDVIGEKPASSPTLHLFPVLVSENEGENIIDMSKEDDEIENDGSLVLLRNACSNIEKGISMANFNSSSNNNNHFPYYQFI